MRRAVKIALVVLCIPCFGASAAPLPDEDFAEILLTCEGWEQITELSVDQSRALARYRGPELPLINLSDVSRSVAENLAAYHGNWIFASLDLSGLTRLTPEILATLSTSNSRELNLSGINSLPETNAAILAKYRGDKLTLGSLGFISVESATELVKFAGDELILDGLTNVTPLVASELAKFRGSLLSLGGVRILDDYSAQELAKFRGARLYLNGLQYLSDYQANALGYYTGDIIDLNSLKQLSIDQAKSLAKFSGKQISLNGLKRLDYRVAISLAAFSGGTILLDGVSHVDETTMQILARYKCQEIWLSAVLEMDKRSVDAIAVFAPKTIWLSADMKSGDESWNLVNTSTKVGLVFDSLSSLGNAPLERLREWSGGLAFPNVTTLNERDIQRLSTLKPRVLALNSVRALTETQALALSQLQISEIQLSGLSDISDESIRILAEFPGKTIIVTDWPRQLRAQYHQIRYNRAMNR